MNFKPFLLVLLLSLAVNNAWAGKSAGGDSSNEDLPTLQEQLQEQPGAKKPTEIKLDESERAKQKALLSLLAAAAVGTMTQYLQDSARFNGLKGYTNLSAGEFSAACGLSAIFSALGIVAEKDLAKSFRSIAWRIPLMALMGGAVSSDKLNGLLSKAPFMGEWFKANPVKDKKGILAIYAIGGWYLIKPSLDRIENFVSNKVSQASAYLSGDKKTQE